MSITIAIIIIIVTIINLTIVVAATTTSYTQSMWCRNDNFAHTSSKPQQEAASILSNAYYVMGGGWDLYTQKCNRIRDNRPTGMESDLTYLTCLTDLTNLPVRNLAIVGALEARDSGIPRFRDSRRQTTDGGRRSSLVARIARQYRNIAIS